MDVVLDFFGVGHAQRGIRLTTGALYAGVLHIIPMIGLTYIIVMFIKITCIIMFCAGEAHMYVSKHYASVLNRPFNS